MPVTARLSKQFYEKFGDQIAGELVDWMNQVDASYRAEFRDLFETHFSRFDAKLEQRIAETRAELHAEMAALRQEMVSQIANLKADLLKWMFLFWTASALTVIGLR